jgi:peptidoglycan/xylan/chitin deacetylase (PgdA/CDA1 family)
MQLPSAMPQPVRVAMIFDDGFANSDRKIADIFESHGLRATFAVLADASERSLGSHGNWALWNELHARGHHVLPHGWNHDDLVEKPIEPAKASLLRCFDAFTDNLRGFDRAATLFCPPNNSMYPELCDWLLTHVSAVRINGTGLNTAADLASGVWHTLGHGPGLCDDHLAKTLETARQTRPAALVYTLHALDDEGWGPISTAGLHKTLDLLTADPDFDYWLLDPASIRSTARHP